MQTLVVVLFLTLTGPDKQVIEVNPDAIIELRAPRAAEHFAPSTRCLVFLSDGKFLSVVDSCTDIKQRVRNLE